MKAIRFAYSHTQAGQTPAMELAYLPMTLLDEFTSRLAAYVPAHNPQA